VETVVVSLSENEMSTVFKVRVNFIFFALNCPPCLHLEASSHSRRFELRNNVMTSDVSAGELRHGMFVIAVNSFGRQSNPMVKPLLSMSQTRWRAMRCLLRIIKIHQIIT